ncbi:hypothetical protein PANT_27c00076 [Moesziomyces antarcticus T-34]|uniref:Zn(2)-C6 fungal-type domain-containing protein n=1 Tax=Pseudozyma antarctica (strain T-34) TaxID=1151754 RepID=M9LTF8_PSEA3|nr:hypothetical protein PANT_27c00076 [Moesziomyces antarcticus T-34]
MQGAPRREHEQQLHQQPHLQRAPASYDHHYPAPPAHDSSAAGAWSSFAPPKLPPPRMPSTLASRAPYADSASAWVANDRRRTSQADLDQLASESTLRNRPHHSHGDPHAHHQPSPSIYRRPSEASGAHPRHDAYERDASRTAELASRMLPDTRNAPLSGSRHALNASRDLAAQPYNSAMPPYPDAHSDRYESHPPLSRRPDERSIHQRVLPHATAEAVDADPRRPDTASSAWSSVRSSSSGVKRSPPQQHAPYPPPYAREAPIPAHAQSSYPHDRDIQERLPHSGKPAATQRSPPASDGFASAQPPLGAIAHGLGAMASQAVAASMSAQHPMQPNRKRLRISRACDECRRRKTRCDIVGAFPGEPGHPLTISGAVPPLEPNMEPKGEMLILQPCMNCRRSEVTCSYSKRPLKRGPSKGYIKDLERRLNSLESQIVSGSDRTDQDAHDVHQDAIPLDAKPGAAPVAPPAHKPKIRTEDRISRLESVLARPSTAKDDDEDPPAFSDARSSEGFAAQVKSEASSDVLDNASRLASEASADLEAVRTSSPSSPRPDPVVASIATAPISPAKASLPKLNGTSDRSSASFKSKNKDKSASRANARSSASQNDVTDVKAKVAGSFLHATFPVMQGRAEGEGSSGSSNNSNIARLEDRVLARGLRLLVEPVEMVTSQPASRDGTPGSQGAKAQQAHAVRVANLVGQASTGLGGLRDELAERGQSSLDSLRALRKVAHRLSAQEADLLMLCHLDHLRNGRNNNSALAAAVSKLGSGSNVQNERETYRRRTVLFMLDRWHAVAFGTPHLLSGRFGMERDSFRSMKLALSDAEASPLGDAVFEVLRCAIMLGQLNDLVQNNGGWKGVSKSDVDAVIHSAMDENERRTATEASDARNGSRAGHDTASNGADVEGGEAGPSLLSTEAMRYSLEQAVRCYYALHTLPNARDARMQDVHRMFNLAEAVIVLGTAKTPISLQGKLIQSAIGPTVLAIAAVAFSWCLRVICMLVASSNADEGASTGASSSTSGADSRARGGESTLYQLEFYRRKMLDYVRMCGPFCLFSGGPPTAPASFAPVYLRLALFFNKTVSLASQMGSLVSPEPHKTSPVHHDPTALGNDADNLLDMGREMGFLGYVLASTTQAEAWNLLTGTAA